MATPIHKFWTSRPTEGWYQLSEDDTLDQHHRSWGALLCSMVIGLLLVLLVVASPALSQPSPGGDWVVTSSESVKDQAVTLDGNLIVQSGGSLTLTNVTLTMTAMVFWI